LVPLNKSATVSDLIKPHYKVILVSRHYLGSINHTLLSIAALKERNLEVFLIFNGNEHPSTEEIIIHKTKVPVLGRIEEEDGFTPQLISSYASRFKEALESI
jgi:dethiobiotin synthetase